MNKLIWFCENLNEICLKAKLLCSDSIWSLVFKLYCTKEQLNCLPLRYASLCTTTLISRLYLSSLSILPHAYILTAWLVKYDFMNLWWTVDACSGGAELCHIWPGHVCRKLWHARDSEYLVVWLLFVASNY